MVSASFQQQEERAAKAVVDVFVLLSQQRAIYYFQNATNSYIL